MAERIVTQADVDALTHTALTMAPPDRLKELENDIAINVAHDEQTQCDFLRAVIREFQSAAVAKYKPAPALPMNDDGTPKHKPDASNPWGAKGWSLKEQGRLCKSIGIKAAGEIAEAAGCKIGSTRPNPAFN